VGYIVDLNNDSADVIAILPYDAYCQRLGPYNAQLVVQYRGTQGYGTLADLLRVPGFTSEMIDAVRACACTVPG
jgi:DNA uptake protein ComE-like DNA-binding protein